jgi:hypothetical protein
LFAKEALLGGLVIEKQYQKLKAERDSVFQPKYEAYLWCYELKHHFSGFITQDPVGWGINNTTVLAILDKAW